MLPFDNPFLACFQYKGCISNLCVWKMRFALTNGSWPGLLIVVRPQASSRTNVIIHIYARLHFYADDIHPPLHDHEIDERDMRFAPRSSSTRPITFPDQIFPMPIAGFIARFCALEFHFPSHHRHLLFCVAVLVVFMCAISAQTSRSGYTATSLCFMKTDTNSTQPFAQQRHRETGQNVYFFACRFGRFLSVKHYLLVCHCDGSTRATIPSGCGFGVRCRMRP